MILLIDILSFRGNDSGNRIFLPVFMLTARLVSANAAYSVNLKGMRFRLEFFSRVEVGQKHLTVVTAVFIQCQHTHRMPILIRALDSQRSIHDVDAHMFMRARSHFRILNIAAIHALAHGKIMLRRFGRAADPILFDHRAAIQTDRFFAYTHFASVVFLVRNPFTIIDGIANHHALMRTAEPIRIDIAALFADALIAVLVSFIESQFPDRCSLQRRAAVVALMQLHQRSVSDMCLSVVRRSPAASIKDKVIFHRLMLMRTVFFLIAAAIAAIVRDRMRSSLNNGFSALFLAVSARLTGQDMKDLHFAGMRCAVSAIRPSILTVISILIFNVFFPFFMRTGDGRSAVFTYTVRIEHMGALIDLIFIQQISATHTAVRTSPISEQLARNGMG